MILKKKKNNAYVRNKVGNRLLTGLFTLAAGLRPVKDVLYCGKGHNFGLKKTFFAVVNSHSLHISYAKVDTFSEWHKADPRNLLVIIGPILNEAYSEKVIKAIEHKPGGEWGKRNKD